MADGGERHSPEQLLAHRDFVVALARALVGAERADDVAQETYLAALRAPPPARWPARAWLAGVVRNLARRSARGESRRRARETAAAGGDFTRSTAEVVEREETRRRVVAAVLTLDEPYRTAVLLRYYDGLSPREIARRLGLPAGTVRSHVHRGLERLRGRLAPMILLPLFPRGVLPMAARKKIAFAVAALCFAATLVAVTAFRGDRATSRATAPPALTADASSPAPPPAATPDDTRDPASTTRTAGVRLVFPVPVEQARALFRAAGRVHVVAEDVLAGGVAERFYVMFGDPATWRRTLPILWDEDGAHVDLEPGRWRLVVERPGAVAHVIGPVEVGDNGVDLEIPLPEALSQRVRVVDEDTREPLPGAVITPWIEYGDDHAFFPGEPIVADEAGEAELPLVPPDFPGGAPTYWIRTDTHAGKAWQNQWNDEGLPDVVPVARAGRVEGFAYLRNGAPAAGREVLFLDDGFSIRATVAEDGSFALEGVPSGRADVFLLEDLAGAAVTHAEVEVLPGGTTTVELGDPVAGGSLRGRLTAGGRPLAGLFVAALGGRDRAATTETGKDGSFRIDGLPAGKTKLMILLGEPFVDDYTLEGEELELAPGDVREFALDLPAGAVRVRVLDARTGEPVAAAGALARPDTPRRELPGFRWKVGWASQTAADGRALLLALPEGEAHAVAVFADGYQEAMMRDVIPGTRDAPAEVTVELTPEPKDPSPAPGR